MLYEYLERNYKPNEPIFVSDIDLPFSATNLRQQFKVLCDSGKIRRFDSGIYYIPSDSRLKGSTSMSADTVVRYKYIARNGCVDGYYSGYTFANQLGISLQVPYTIEVVSNAASAKVREISLKGQRVILRKPKTKITEQNCRVLQFLDLLKDIDLYTDESKEETSEKLSKYISDAKIKQSDIDTYISLYPDKVYRNLYEMRLYSVFAS